MAKKRKAKRKVKKATRKAAPSRKKTVGVAPKAGGEKGEGKKESS